MDEQIRNRLNQATTALFHKLGPGYYFNSNPSRPDVAFGVVRKNPPGVQPRIQLLGEITRRQATMIAQTSLTDAELLQRMYDLLINGIDTVKQPAAASHFTTADVERIVSEQVAKALRAYAEASTRGTAPEAMLEAASAAKVNVARGVSTAAGDLTSQAVGIRTRKKDPNLPSKLDQQRQRIETWRERCKLMGVPSPRINALGGIDGFQLGRLKKAWAKFSEEPQHDTTQILTAEPTQAPLPPVMPTP